MTNIIEFVSATSLLSCLNFAVTLTCGIACSFAASRLDMLLVYTDQEFAMFHQTRVKHT